MAETIASVVRQSYTDWELIIIDDGSKDDTASIVKKYTNNEKITYFYQENTGVSIARNHGIRKAKGEFIAFLDADDIWEKENLKKKVEFLQNNKSIGWVYSDMYLTDEKDQKRSLAPLGTDQNILDNILLWEEEVVPGPCSNIVVRRTFIEQGIKFDPDLSTAADQDFCIQLASKMRGAIIKEPLWAYRVLGNSMSRNIAVMEKDHTHVFKKAKKNKLFHSFWFKQKCFSNLYLILAGSWWINGNNKLRGSYFILRSLLSYPPNIFTLLQKLK